MGVLKKGRGGHSVSLKGEGMLDSRLSCVRRVTKDLCREAACHSVEGEPEFLEGMDFLSVLWVSGSYNEVISINADLNMWRCGLW